ncbi:MAG: YIP1 family protein [Spirochaetales bacterium]
MRGPNWAAGRALALALLLGGSLAAQTAPWWTWTSGRLGWWVGSPTAYLPAPDLELPLGLADPEDVATDAAGRILVADTGNGRLQLGTPAEAGWNWVTVGEGTLQKPSGVAFGPDGRLWVADAGDDTVSAWSQQGERLLQLGRPDSKLFGEKREFKPRKLVVDHQGTVTVMSQGSSNGLVVLSSVGEFLGYYGVNPVKLDLQLLFQRLIFNKEQQARLLSSVPPSPDNLSLDQEGLILTVTKGDKAGLRRLNVAGSNLLASGYTGSKSLADVATDAQGHLLTVNAGGFVTVHDREGNIIFGFSASADPQLAGGVKSASGLAALPDGSLLLLDNARGLLIHAVPTAFARLVYQGLDLHEQGKYLESRGLWEQVLARDALFALAHQGIARGQFLAGDYETALGSFERGNGRQGWSDSFRELRDRWFGQYLAPTFGTLLLVLSVWSWFASRHRKAHPRLEIPVYRRILPWQLSTGTTWQEKLTLRLQFVGWFALHPLDGATAIRRHQVFGPTAALLVLLGATLLHLASYWLASWLFARPDLEWLNLTTELLVLIVPVVVVALANWLVSTLDFGNGKGTQVLSVLALSLVPLVISWPVFAVVSRALSLQEAFLLDFGAAAAWGWSVSLGLAGLAELHGFSFRQMVKNVLLTVFAALILALVAGFLYVLWDQLAGFLTSLFSEAQAHARR